jgi:type I restriction enzyme S subunit
MSANWPLVTLSELLRLERRPVELKPEQQYQEIGIFCFGRGIFHKPPRTGLEIGDKKLYELRERDLILQVTFAWEGAIALCSKAEHGLYGSTRYPTFRVDKTRCLAPFLVRYLGTRDGLEQINKICPGSAGRNRVLSLKRIHEVVVPLPPLPEQRRIVARIEELATKINEARGLRQRSAEEAEAFVTSFHAKLAGTRMKKLDDILRLDEDLVAVTPTGSYPQVGIKSFGAGLFAKSAVTGSETTYKIFNRLYEGALVLSQVKGWEGAVAICPAKLTGWFVSPEYRTFRCVENQARPGYLAPLVRTQWFWEKLGRATRGVGARRERTRPEQFMNIEIPIPTIEKQAQGERVFAKVDALKKHQTETAAELDALLPSILDKAFKGEL